MSRSGSWWSRNRSRTAGEQEENNRLHGYPVPHGVIDTNSTLTPCAAARLMGSLAELPAPVRLAVEAADDRKARQITVLDLRGLNDATDFFVVASGTSDAHVRGIADAVLDRLGALRMPPHHVEGVQTGRWVLLDFVDFVVHVFHPETRAFYRLERLWSDAPALTYMSALERKAP